MKKRSAGRPELREQSVTGGTSRNKAQQVAEACQTALTAIDRLFNELEIYSDLNDGMRSKSEYVTSLSQSIRMLSLNGTVEAEQLGTIGSGMGKVLEWLQWFSRDITQGCEDLTTSLAHMISEIKSVVFDLSSAKLQIEMTTNFAVEIVRRGARDASPNADITQGAMRDLYASSRGTVERALAALATVENNLFTLDETQQSLRKSIRSLRLIYFKGKVELASVASERLGIIFDDVNRHLADTENNLGILETLIQDLRKELHRGVEHRGPIEQAVAKIEPGSA